MSNAEIIERLDILILLSVPPYLKEKYSSGHDVLPFCDGTYTLADIVRKTKKKKEAIAKALQRLRDSGIIKSIIKEYETYYIRII